MYEFELVVTSYWLRPLPSDPLVGKTVTCLPRTNKSNHSKSSMPLMYANMVMNTWYTVNLVLLSCCYSMKFSFIKISSRFLLR